MTEDEWLECDKPGRMDLYLREKGQLGHRKVRLFGCACVRGVWQDLPHEALREAIGIYERFADGQATAAELSAARELANGTYEGIGDIVADHSAIAITAL